MWLLKLKAWCYYISMLASGMHVFFPLKIRLCRSKLGGIWFSYWRAVRIGQHVPLTTGQQLKINTLIPIQGPFPLLSAGVQVNYVSVRFCCLLAETKLGGLRRCFQPRASSKLRTVRQLAGRDPLDLLSPPPSRAPYRAVAASPGATSLASCYRSS